MVSGKNNLYSVFVNFIAVMFVVLSFAGTATAKMSITILEPRTTGLKENQSHLPVLVQSGFVTVFSRYPHIISVLDQKAADRINLELMNERYDDDAAEALITVGQEIPTTHYMAGNITKTSTGYAFQMNIIRTSDKMTIASEMDNFSHWDLEDQTAVRRLSLKLLPKIGVTLTESVQQELAGAVEAGHAQSRAALARAVTAQRQGNEVAALSHFLQASVFDPTLTDAVNRVSILQANISSGRMGGNIRDDIEWRRQWVERLKETEEFIENFTNMESMPYTMFYVVDGIRQSGQINYQNETVAMNMPVHLYASGIWALSIERTLQVVYDGLQATGKAREWGLGNWPQQSVTSSNLLEKRSDSFDVAFELLNNQNNVIARSVLRLSGSWELNRRGRPAINVNTSTNLRLTNEGYSVTSVPFHNIKANDITDYMSVRVASINGADAEAAAIDGVLQVRAITRYDFSRNAEFKFERGELQGFAKRQNVRKGYALRLNIPNTIWGDPIISIGAGAFKGIPISGAVIIPNSVTSIGEEAFWGCQFESLTIGANVTMSSNSFGGDGFHAFPSNYNQNGKSANTYTASRFRFERGEIQGFMFMQEQQRGGGLNIPSSIWGNPVTSIGAGAFKNIGLNNITIPNSVTFIGADAFHGMRGVVLVNNVRKYPKITIGSNVSMVGNPFQISGDEALLNNNFLDCYNRNGKQAGVYSYIGSRWFFGENREEAEAIVKQKEKNTKIWNYVFWGALIVVCVVVSAINGVE